MRALVLILAGTSLLAAGARADIVVPGADGSDGPFSPTSDVVVDLSLAPTGAWDGPNTSPGNGVYDPEKWAVVFRYSSVNVPSGVTVTFLNHPSGAPVVWLVSEGVTIAGTVSLDGQPTQGILNRLSRPGPGGFHGGVRHQSSTLPRGEGAGPGGGGTTGNPGDGGSHATRGIGSASGSTYGNIRIIPLIGGSGGAAPISNCNSCGGGAGGGALLIAAQSAVVVSGALRANGGSGSDQNGDSFHQGGGGSGGAIRIAADSLSVSGAVNAVGSGSRTGGSGRIRLDVNSSSITGSLNPAPSSEATGTAAVLWPEPSAPQIRVVSLAGVPVSSDPQPRDEAFADVELDITNPVELLIETENVPTDWIVRVRIVPRSGATQQAVASLVGGGLPFATWQAQVTVPIERSWVQVRASAP